MTGGTIIVEIFQDQEDKQDTINMFKEANFTAKQIQKNEWLFEK